MTSTSSPDPVAALGGAIERALDDAIAGGVCSAAAAAVGDATRGWTWLRGRTRAVPTAGPPIHAATPFDLASLTKPIATAAIAMTLVGEGRLDLDAPAARWLEVPARDLTVAHLLGHASGFPPHVKLYERLWAGELGGAPDPRAALTRLALATPLERAPGVAAAYSDLGYIALGALLERTTGRPLDELLALVTEPLGLTATRYVDLRGARSPLPAEPVATELDPRRGLVAGEVHDENAHAGGGVAGHAGLFAPIGDVARFAAALARAPGAPGPVGRLRPAVVRHFLTTAAAPGTSWRLGWDTPSTTPGVSHAGDAWPRVHSAGHLGFTGTSMWLDLAHARWAVLLTNRVHPARDRPEAARIKDLRRRFGDLAWALLAS